MSSLSPPGKGEIPREIKIESSPIRYWSEQDLKIMMELKGYVPKPGTDLKAFVNYDRGTQIHFDLEGEGNNPDEPTHIDIRLNQDRRKEYVEMRQSYYTNLLNEKKAELQELVDNGSMTERDMRKEVHRIEKIIKERLENYEEYKSKRRVAYGDERPPSNEPPPEGPGKTPGEKSFEELLQQTHLTESYNSIHQESPLAAKGMTAGDIGGVAASADYIEGLFDSPEASLEQDHIFCLPHQQPPFTQDQLHQILRELAIGIYAHGTVPFFSLHFRQGTHELFPVIHPVYERTLVGRVISMLDYIMKGYLNGGCF